MCDDDPTRRESAADLGELRTEILQDGWSRSSEERGSTCFERLLEEDRR
jgi:hypothetical protein